MCRKPQNDRKITLEVSLAKARSWYASTNLELKALALEVYSVDELTKLSVFDCVAQTNTKVLLSISEYASCIENINIVANYLNKGWKKKDGDVGYFWRYEKEKGWVMMHHTTYTYPGITYYKTDKIAQKAKKSCTYEYDYIIFNSPNICVE